MKNKLTNLNDHLFMQLERLNDETKTGDELKQEIARAKSISEVAANIIANAQTVIAAERLRNNMPMNEDLPKMLEQK